MPRLKNHMRAILPGSAAHSGDLLQRQRFSVFMLFGFPGIVGFMLYNFASGNLLLGLVELAILILFSIMSALVWKQKASDRIVYSVGVAVFGMFLFSLLWLTRQADGHVLWHYTFPLVAIFLLGRSLGGAYCLIQLLALALLMGFQESFGINPFTAPFAIRLVVSLSMIASISIWFDGMRERGFNELKQEQEHLAAEVRERQRVEMQRETLITELRKALQEVKTLSGFLPICAKCHKIRDDQGFWNRIEEYLHDHADVTFSHGICPECSDEFFMELDKEESDPGSKD